MGLRINTNVASLNAQRNLIATAVIETPCPSDSLSDSSNATVKGEIVIAPTAIESAAVTLELGPYAVVNNGKATAAEFGKPPSVQVQRHRRWTS